MKKYIRTKDGRIELVAGSVIDQTSTLFYDDNKGNYISEKDIFKQTDTVEELCDEFVCGENHLLLKLYELKSEDFKEDVKDIVYGAIWTDKGLIYVAKMNEKGELELL